MSLSLNQVRQLTEIPMQFTADSDKVDYIISNNPNVLKKVNAYLSLSNNMKKKVMNMILTNQLLLTSENIKIINSFQREDIVKILDHNINYIYLINRGTISHQTYMEISADKDLELLLEKKHIKLEKKKPYLGFLCIKYVLKLFDKNEVQLKDIINFFPNYNYFDQSRFLSEYFKKGYTDITKFKCKEDNRNIPIFKSTRIETVDGKNTIYTTDIQELLQLLKLGFNVTKIYLNSNEIYEENILHLLRYIQDKDIELNVKNGLNYYGNLDGCLEFIRLSGGLGTIELIPLDEKDIEKLISICKQYPNITLNFRLNTFMTYEDFFLKLEDNDNIKIYSDKKVSELSLKEMKNIDKIMDKLVKDIKESKLSPYEKYIQVYNLVKSLKEFQFFYNDEKLDDIIIDQSRNPYLIMFNNYIVCSGFCAILSKFLNKVGIPNLYWEFDCKGEKGRHARLYVNMKDEKYDMNLYFMCDPTWDNTDMEDAELHGYKYLNMTMEEVHNYEDSSLSYYYFGRDSKLFGDEIFIKPEEFLSQDYNIPEAKIIMSQLDPEFYQQLSNYSNEEIKEKIINRIHEKTSTPIPLQKKYSAILTIIEYNRGKELTSEERQNISEKLYQIEKIEKDEEKEIYSIKY